MLIETKEIQLGGNPTVSEAGIQPWIREGLGLGGSTLGGGDGGGARRRQRRLRISPFQRGAHNVDLTGEGFQGDAAVHVHTDQKRTLTVSFPSAGRL